MKKQQKKKEQSEFDPYFNPYMYKENVISDRGIDAIGKEVVIWAIEDDDALKLRFFFSCKGICTRTTTRWRKRNKRFDSAYALAKAIIGDKREIGGLKRQLDPALVMRTMALYDDEFRELEKWRSALKKQEKEEAQKVNFDVRLRNFSVKKEKSARKTGKST